VVTAYGVGAAASRHGRAVPADDGVGRAGRAEVLAARAAGGHELADGVAEAEVPNRVWYICVELPLETASMIPRVRPSAIGTARGTAMRLARLLPRRRDAGRCPLSIQATSSGLPGMVPVHHGRPGPPTKTGEFGRFALCKDFLRFRGGSLEPLSSPFIAGQNSSEEAVIAP
jgi:hypothetical protein